LCGWRFVPGNRNRGPVDAILFGPNIRRARLNVHRSLIDEWAKKAARKSSLWSPKELSRLPRLLVVLEKWTTPTWTHVQWDEEQDSAGESVLGLVSTGEPDAPTWQYLAMPGETLTVSYRVGNTAVPRMFSMLSLES
jgi:hypothetical protein